MAAPVEADVAECRPYELLHGVTDPGRDDVVAGLLALHHEPHRADVIPGIAPVAPRAELAEHELPLETERDRRRRARNLARNEVERPPRRLVVVEDPAAR